MARLCANRPPNKLPVRHMGLSTTQGANPAQCAYSKQSWSLQLAEDNHGSDIIGRHMQPTQETLLECLAVVTRGNCIIGNHGTSSIQGHYFPYHETGELPNTQKQT